MRHDFDHDFMTGLGIRPENPAACSAGQWLAGERVFASINPASGQPIAEVGSCARAHNEGVIQEAIARFEAWRSVPAPRRGELVRRIGLELRRCKDELGSLIALETGKIKAEGDGEVQEMIDIADFAVGQSRMLYGRMMHSERPHHRMYEQWHPLGAVGVITAFNFPGAVWAWNAFIAAVAGNVTVWKPSPKAPLTAIAIQNLLNHVTEDTGHRGVFSLVVTDENALVKEFVADPRVSLVSFTGSSAVGKRVAETVARRMGKCLLECSGNNANIHFSLLLWAVRFENTRDGVRSGSSARRHAAPPI